MLYMLINRGIRTYHAIARSVIVEYAKSITGLENTRPHGSIIRCCLMAARNSLISSEASSALAAGTP